MSGGPYTRHRAGRGDFGPPSTTDPSGEELTTVWVGNLQGDITSEGLYEEFQPYGCVLNAAVSPKTAPSGARSGFVRFATRGEATLAVNAAAWGRVTVEGLPVLCEWAKSNARGGYSGAYVEQGSSPYGGSPYGGGPYGGGGAYGGNPYGGGPYGRSPYGDYAGGPRAATAAAAYGRGWHNFHGQAAEEYEEVEQAPAKYGGARRRRPDRARSRRGGAPPPMPPMNFEEYGGDDELTTLWVGNLAEGTTDADIVGVFSQLGQVLVATVHNRPSPMGSYNGFVRMATRLEAEHALSWCQSSSIQIKGSSVVAKWAKMNSKVDAASLDYLTYQMVTPAEPAEEPRAGELELQDASDVVAVPTKAPPSNGGGVKTLWLGSIPVDATAEDVRQAFVSVGLEGNVSLNQSRPSPRGLSGFIRFDSLEAAQMAYNLLTESSMELGGSTLAFDWAKQDTFS